MGELRDAIEVAMSFGWAAPAAALVILIVGVMIARAIDGSKAWIPAIASFLVFVIVAIVRTTYYPWL